MSLFGFLNCLKPPGMTSRDVVNVVQRRLRQGKTKVGHAGTLDPIAEGVLVIGVGSAVRLVPWVQQYPKAYLGMFRLGVCSESGDTESELSTPSGLREPTLKDLQAAAPDLVGTIEQIPPTYSAIHVGGKRAYERIRAGEVFEMPSRQVEVHSLDVLRHEHPDMEIKVVCGSGTYIRTVGLDLARAVGSSAVMTSLRRTRIGPFRVEDAVSLERLREDDLEAMLLPPSLAVQQLPWMLVDPAESRRLGHGLEIDGDVYDAEGNKMPETWQQGDQIAALTQRRSLRAIMHRKQSTWHPYRVFPLKPDEPGYDG